MNKRKIIIAAILLLIIAAAGIWWFALRREGSDGSEAPAYRYQLVERGSIISTLEGVGTVQPVNSYTVRALVTGEVLSAPFKEGDTIEAGQLLYQIDAGRAQNSCELARLSLQEAEAAVKKLRITAPVAGQIVAIYREIGDSVNPGDRLLYLRDREKMTLEVPFKIDEAKQLQVGGTAEVVLEKDGRRVPGRLTAISNVEQVSVEGVLTNKVTVDVEDPDGLLEGDWAAVEAAGFTSVRSGLLEYSYSEQILAEINGEVAEILVSEGDRVQKGQTLIRIANVNLENDLSRAKIELDNARAALTDYTITSPIAGTVIEKKFEQGDTIDGNNSASEMAVIYDMSKLEFVMNVDELDIGLIAVGQPVQVVADALGGQEFAGRVSKISVKGNSSNGVTTYPITVTLDEFGALLPGMNVNAEVVLQQAEDVLIVPMNAVGRGNMLLVEGGDGQPGELPGFCRRQVELGLNDDYYVEIRSGVREGERIAVPTGAAGDN